jgi:hypothetical protein
MSSLLMLQLIGFYRVSIWSCASEIDLLALRLLTSARTRCCFRPREEQRWRLLSSIYDWKCAMFLCYLVAAKVNSFYVLFFSE